MQIRKATSKDAKGIYDVERNTFSTPWSQESIQKDLAKDHAYYYVAEDDGQIVGYIGVHHLYLEAEVTNIAVSKIFRGKKIGQRLVNAIIKHAKEHRLESVFLEVRESNILAKTLYEKSGFKEIGRRKNYYSKPKEDALLMALNIEH